MLNITFLGAAKTVTGSCYLVESDNVKFLVDCGMFQEIEYVSRNYESFEFDPKELDFVLVTHAHIDHIGLIPKLIRYGFDGPIYTTPETAKIAYHLLLDAAKIQEINESKRNQSKSQPALYSTENAQKAIDLFETVGFGSRQADRGVYFQFNEVGHVLGASSIDVKVEGKKLVFSGDIGRSKHMFLPSFSKESQEADYIIMEALYGGKYHEPKQETIDKFVDKVNEVLKRNGNVIIPSFALQRTQELLYILKKAYGNNQIKRSIPVFVDSPLATKVTYEYSRHVFLGDDGGEVMGRDLFEFDPVRFVKHSKKVIGKKGGGSIIIAGSGMASGGRIMNHLAHGLPNERNCVMIVGYQAEGTLGRELISEPRPKTVRIGNKDVHVRAELEEFYGFSAHGDQNDLSAWLNRFNAEDLRNVFLIHAEPDRIENFEEEIQGFPFYAPEWKEKISL